MRENIYLLSVMCVFTLMLRDWRISLRARFYRGGEEDVALYAFRKTPLLVMGCVKYLLKKKSCSHLPRDCGKPCHIVVPLEQVEF